MYIIGDTGNIQTIHFRLEANQIYKSIVEMVRRFFHSILLSIEYALIVTVLGPIGLPLMFIPPVLVLLGAIALGFIGVGLVIFILSGGALFFFPVVWLAWLRDL